MSVPPSPLLGAQPVGEVARIAEGVYQLKVPVPFPLVFVSAYLVEGNDGWTLVDTGFDYPEGRKAWETGARQLGFSLDRDVRRIVVTHFHPDHLGLARWLQWRSGAPVWMLEGEIEHSREVWEEAEPGSFADYLVRNGMDREGAGKGARRLRTGLALPDEMVPLQSGEELDLGGSAVRVVHAPGHADHQLALHDRERGILLAADHVMLGLTPNIGLWPDSEPRPLARYLRSLLSFRGLSADLVLPGHGPVFHDLAGRIDELLLHHEERLDLMHGLLEDGGPLTPFEVSRRAFRYALSVYERCFALAETLAHLEHLVEGGKAERVEGEPPVAFRAV